MKQKTGQQRIVIIDEVRGFCIILVVIYHLFYNTAYNHGFLEEIFFSPLLDAIRNFFAGVFVFVSGLSCNLSRNNARRGALLLAVAAAVTAITLFFGVPIWFGILHLLAVCMLAFSGLKRFISKIPAKTAIIICSILFVITFNIQQGVIGIFGFNVFVLPNELFMSNFGAPFGFCPPSFFSADYFPLLPWFFLFMTGAIFGRRLSQTQTSEFPANLPDWMYHTRFRPFAFLGRHSLFVYLLHQPVLYAVEWFILLLTVK